MQKSCEFDLIEIKLFAGSTKQKYWWPIRSDIGQKFCFFPACPTCGTRMLLVLHSAWSSWQCICLISD